MDWDMLVRADIAELWRLRDERYAVMVVKHQHVPRETVKFLGEPQTKYEKKNWSSVMLINCAHYHNRCLTPNYVRSHDGAHLHRLAWITDQDRIGDLPREWNWLVEEYPHNDAAKLLHYTIGTPCFSHYANCDHADVWHQERAIMLSCEESREEAA
jgi:lipopolysaccharide biosynthesis glycosyltransferase